MSIAPEWEFMVARTHLPKYRLGHALSSGHGKQDVWDLEKQCYGFSTCLSFLIFLCNQYYGLQL